MATRAKRFCHHGGCHTLSADTYCPEHAPLHVYVETRQSADARGYDGKWRKVRDRYLRQHPLCERHGKQHSVVMASVVHHIVPIDSGGARLDPANLMSLCRDCHEVMHGRKIERQ